MESWNLQLSSGARIVELAAVLTLLNPECTIPDHCRNFENSRMTSGKLLLHLDAVQHGRKLHTFRKVRNFAVY